MLLFAWAIPGNIVEEPLEEFGIRLHGVPVLLVVLCHGEVTAFSELDSQVAIGNRGSIAG